MTLYELVVFYGSNHSGKASHDIIKVLHFLRVTPFQHCQHNRNILKNLECSTFNSDMNERTFVCLKAQGNSDVWESPAGPNGSVKLSLMVLHPPLKFSSLWRVQRAALSATSPTITERERRKLKAATWVSERCDILLPGNAHTSPCHSLHAFFWWEMQTHHSRCTDLDRLWLMGCETGQTVSLSRIEDKPTPLRAIRSWPQLLLSLSHTLSRCLHDNKSPVPR